MAAQKPVVLALLSLMLVSNVSVAGSSHHAPSAHTPYHQSVDLDALLNHQNEIYHTKLQQHLKTFLSEIPDEPVEAIKYIFAKLNEAQVKDGGRNLEYNLNILDSIPGGKTHEINPKFSYDSKLVLDLNLKRSLIKNPVYFLEVMSELQLFFNNQTNFELTSKMSGKSTQYHYYLGHHGYYVQSHHVVSTFHYHYEATHSAFEALGLSFIPTQEQMSPLLWAEININAANGSPYAQKEILWWKDDYLKSAMNGYKTFKLLKNVSETDRKEFILQLANEKGIELDSKAPEATLAASYFNQQIQNNKNKSIEILKLAKSQYAKDKAQLEDPKKKALKDSLESKAQKLNDLVKANDRKGVADLLEVYLEMNTMEPVEKALWTQWLEAIRNPDPKNTMLLFRGLDQNNDKPQITLDSKGNEIGYSFFSTLLNRNQGNYTRRLRSLTTMRYRFQNGSNQTQSPVNMTPKISTMMHNHSIEPVGSPMLSFTTNPDVAHGFGDYGIIAVKMDARRVLPNIVSGFTHELELLVPLVIFPDEVIHFEKGVGTSGSYDTGGKYTYYESDFNKFITAVNQKLGHSYTLDVEQNPKKLFVGAYKVFADLDSRIGNKCQSIFLK